MENLDNIEGIAQTLAIALILFITLIANYSFFRRHEGETSPLIRSEDSDFSSNESFPTKPWYKRIINPTSLEYWFIFPKTEKFHDAPFSRLLRKWPFLLEIWYLSLIYWPYQIALARSAIWINGDPQTKSDIELMAKNHALDVFNLEETLGFDMELPIHKFVTSNCKPWVLSFLQYICASNIVIVVACICYAYTFLARRRYRALRRTLAMAALLSFAVLTAYRELPPKRMPPSFGFSPEYPGAPLDPLPEVPGGGDLLHGRGLDIGGSFDASQLTVASMPSLQFGTSLLFGCATGVLAPHWYIRFMAPFYPFLTFIALLATANNWVIDCFAGAIVVLIAWNLNRLLLLLRPFEETGFWLIRTQKPVELDAYAGHEDREGRHLEYHRINGVWRWV